MVWLWAVVWLELVPLHQDELWSIPCMFIFEPRIEGKLLLGRSSSHGHGRGAQLQSIFQVLACIFSTNMPLSKVSHVAELGDRDQEAQSAHNWPKARA